MVSGCVWSVFLEHMLSGWILAWGFELVLLLIVESDASNDVDGSNLPLGATSQNNYKPVQTLRCGDCFARVLETETELHVCEE